MNVLVCAACGRHLSEPLRLLPELPERPEYDGLPNADGSRHAPPTVPRGTYAVGSRPCGAPCVPHPDPLAEPTHDEDTWALNGEIRGAPRAYETHFLPAAVRVEATA